MEKRKLKMEKRELGTGKRKKAKNAKVNRVALRPDTVGCEGEQVVSCKVVAEVDDGVLEFALAAWGVANAACFVLLGFLSAAHAEVSHVLSSALQAKLEVGVSVEVSEDVGVDTTLAVEAVNVLAHEALEDASVLQFNHGHVSPCGSGLLDCRVEGNAVGVRKSLARFLHVILVLILEGGLLPAAWAGLEHSAISRAVVRDSGRSRNSCTGEEAEILALANPLS